jgi:predicted Zn-dependent protease
MREHPDAPEYAYLEGQILLRLGDEAAAAGVRAGDRGRSRHVPARQPAQIEARASRLDGARGFLQRALARRADDAEALRTLGDVEARGGREGDAIAAYEKALQADPGSPISKSALARALAGAGRDLDRAVDLARAAREADPSSADFAEALGRVLHRGIYSAA